MVCCLAASGHYQCWLIIKGVLGHSHKTNFIGSAKTSMYEMSFLWSLFLVIPLEKIWHWFYIWLGTEQAICYYQDQWWPSHGNVSMTFYNKSVTIIKRVIGDQRGFKLTILPCASVMYSTYLQPPSLIRLRFHIIRSIWFGQSQFNEIDSERIL